MNNLEVIPYTATSISLVGRFIFMFLLYKNTLEYYIQV